PSAPVRTGRELLIPTVLDARASTPAPATPTTTAVPVKTSRFTWPVQGPVRRGYRSRAQGDRHDGLDIDAPHGTAVGATAAGTVYGSPAAGTVIFAGPEASQFGNLVVVDHGDGWHSAYGSLARVTVKSGYKIARGERLGLVGDTSATKRTELHFELRHNGKPV